MSAGHVAAADWERLHRIFHRTLISQCRSASLIGFCDHLADQL